MLGEKLMTMNRNKPDDKGKMMLGKKENRVSHPDSPEGVPQKKKCCQ